MGLKLASTTSDRLFQPELPEAVSGEQAEDRLVVCARAGCESEDAVIIVAIIGMQKA